MAFEPSNPSRENRPWTRWWWMGSALDEAEITRHLELFQVVGLGGVEVSPIYGVTGDEARWVPFLSDRWIDLLAHTLREAERLDLGVDLIAGTGWPYGGPWVLDSDAPGRLIWETIGAGRALVSSQHPEANLLATGEPDLQDSRLALFLAPTGQQVKRAAPGGAGNVVDHFSANAVGRYLAAFDKALSKLPKTATLRCVFNDSYEVYGATGTLLLFDEFAERRGYDLRPYLHALHGVGEYTEIVQRVRSDYRETIGDLLQDGFLGTWTDWAQGHGIRTRHQAHGSPGNLLDLYAAADIPETEVFGPPRLKKAGLEPLRPAPPDFGEAEEALICRFASSAAHVAGRPLCSSESFTWMGEHGCVSLEHAKAEVDTLFTLGINHLFFHGTPHSPVDAEWPGYLFYATTHIAPTNPFWRDLPALNAYITACQSVLQAGLPDNDVLLYFPYYDLLATENGAKDGLHALTVHNTNVWLRENLAGFTAAARDLTEGGWTYDLVSDRQLRVNVSVEDGEIVAATGGSRWRALVVAGSYLMPPETLEAIAALVGDGATVLFLGDLPGDVPGLSDWELRRERLAEARMALRSEKRVFSGYDLAELMREAGIAPEPITGTGIEFIRRRDEAGHRTYFLANPGTNDWEGGIALHYGGMTASLLDPMTGDEGTAAIRFAADGSPEVYLAIPAGGSRIYRADTLASLPSGFARPPRTAGSVDWVLDGPWKIDFLEGVPVLPSTHEIAALTDWTAWVGADADTLQAFSGTARYTIEFDDPAAEANDFWLDLGAVCHSARVYLNGVEQGTLFARPWRLRLKSPLRLVGNLLEIEVTNLMANRLADLERRVGDAWRPFLFVNIRYQPFDAADWEPLPSGLLGPVRLIGV